MTDNVVGYTGNPPAEDILSARMTTIEANFNRFKGQLADLSERMTQLEASRIMLPSPITTKLGPKLPTQEEMEKAMDSLMKEIDALKPVLTHEDLKRRNEV